MHHGFQVTVLYTRVDEEPFDFEYYKSIHMGLVTKFFGNDVWHLQVERGVEGGRSGSKPAFVALCRLKTHSSETWHKHIGSNLEEFLADIPNFTKIQPTILMTEVIE